MSVSLDDMEKKQKRHTIVLLQFTVKTDTKRWYDFPSVNEAMMGIVRIYEEEIQRLNPHMKSCTYTIDELFEYIGGLGDISCLVLVPSTGAYEPHGVKFIKDSIYELLNKQAK